VNGVTGAALTRLDVLDNFPAIQVCTEYRLDGGTTDAFPATSSVLERCTPVYEEHEGWRQSTAGARTFGDLPKGAQAYVERIEELLGCPIQYVSVGPERDQIILR
jgi:adenylosuccinate synthase